MCNTATAVLDPASALIAPAIDPHSTLAGALEFLLR
jgi:hypothetical protein